MRYLIIELKAPGIFGAFFVLRRASAPRNLFPESCILRLASCILSPESYLPLTTFSRISIISIIMLDFWGYFGIMLSLFGFSVI